MHLLFLKITDAGWTPVSPCGEAWAQQCSKSDWDVAGDGPIRGNSSLGVSRCPEAEGGWGNGSPRESCIRVWCWWSAWLIGTECLKQNLFFFFEGKYIICVCEPMFYRAWRAVIDSGFFSKIIGLFSGVICGKLIAENFLGCRVGMDGIWRPTWDY